MVYRIELERNHFRMEKIRIITESASDMGTPEREDVTVLPMHITFGEKEYLDGVNLSHREFYNMLIESDELPKTSLISPGTFADEFEKAEKAGEQVVVIVLSAKLSGTYQSAMVAAADYDNVTVVDSESVAVGERILVDYALRLKDQGKTAAEIAEELETAKKKVHVIALLDTLEYLKKGGRISKSVAMIGGMLSIKPVVTVEDGVVAVLGKARGSKNGNNLLVKEIQNAGGIDFSLPFWLGYTGINDALLQKYIQDSKVLWKDYTEELPICTIGATIGTHVGPNAVAVAFFGKEG